MSFTPRVTPPVNPELSTYWTTFTGECVWYTIGRLRETALTPITDPDRAWPVTISVISQAKQIYPNADESNGYIRDGSNASLGALMCWDGIDGHCANVELISGNMITFSGYNFPASYQFNLLTYSLDDIVNSRIAGLGHFQGFVRNPYVTQPTRAPILASVFNRTKRRNLIRRFRTYVKL